MTRWLIGIGLFVVFAVTVMSSWVGLYLAIIGNLFYIVIALLVLASLAIWLSGPMSNLWKSN
jgi:hypothetical protein